MSSVLRPSRCGVQSFCSSSIGDSLLAPTLVAWSHLPARKDGKCNLVVVLGQKGEQILMGSLHQVYKKGKHTYLDKNNVSS